MAGEWLETTVGTLLREHGGSIKTGPFGTALKAAEYTPDGVPVISVGEIGYGRLTIHKRTPRVDSSVTSRLSEYVLEEGDIVFARKGAVDRAALIRKEHAGWFLGSDGIRVRPPKMCNSRFLLYWFQSEDIRNWILQNSPGTIMASLNQEIVGRIPLKLPSEGEQSRISDALGSLDDKIDLNLRLAKTLEAIALALFSSWFVDFDPVHARGKGLSAGLTEAVAGLFPAALNSDGIPHGWTLQTVGDLFDVSGGNTPSTAEAGNWDGPHQWATPKDLSSLASPVLLQTNRRITDVGLAKSTSGLLPTGSLLLSSRAPIGYMAFAARPVAINQGFAGLVRKQVSTVYAWGWCAAHMDMIKGNAGGSTFPEISKSVLRHLPMLRPSDAVLAAFETAAEPLVGKMIATVEEAASLAALRDALLPRLMAGELRIRDAEKAVAAA